MPQPDVTIVVVPRERFSYARESLESVYAHTAMPFRLVYVDGGSPRPVRAWLEASARERGFEIIRTDRYLTPNRARNLGLDRAGTYTVFIDNDVQVTPGWLTTMVSAAESSGADVVTPLICQGRPVGRTVHAAGGRTGIREEERGGKVERHVFERMDFHAMPVAEVRDRFRAGPTEFAEFHCMLVRTELFETVGPLDEGFLATREHVDFCLTVLAAGGTIRFEPASVVTYVPGPPLKPYDLHYFMLRWSDLWEAASLDHFRRKWGLSNDGYFRLRYRNVGLRRRMTLVKPLVRRIAFGRDVRVLEEVLWRLERVLNRGIVALHGPPNRGAPEGEGWTPRLDGTRSAALPAEAGEALSRGGDGGHRDSV